MALRRGLVGIPEGIPTALGEKPDADQLDLPAFTTTVKGFAPAPGSSTGAFLRDDGIWAVPTGASIQAQWEFKSSTVMADPGAGNFRMNNGTPALVTAIAIHEENKAGADFSTILNNLVAGNVIYIQQITDATRVILLDVVSVTDNGTWFEITVTVADSGTIFQDGQECGVIFAAGGSAVVAGFPLYTFEADQFENPNNSDWAVNSLAAAVADTNNNGLTNRGFDDTTEEGVGFKVKIHPTAANVILRFFSRAETTDAAARTVGLRIYEREKPDNAVVTAWSAGLQLTDIDIPTNEFWQYDEQTLTLAALGVTAGSWHQFELTRIAPSGGTNLVGDWDLLAAEVTFS